MNNNILYLPISIGEGLDKLSILDIKLEKNNDERKHNILNEYNKLYIILKQYTINNKMYTYIKKINILIWELMELLRDNKEMLGEKYSDICKKCIDYNDIRFRIKNKINLLLNSELKEQKCYNITKLYIYINNKIDNIELFFNFIEYYSFMYDEIYINSNNTKLIQYFNYDTTIIINNVLNNDIKNSFLFVNDNYTKNDINNIFNITINIFE
jgi:hypothetical protein